MFGRYILFNLTSIFYWRVLAAKKQWQVDIDNVRENTSQVRHDYEIGNIVYVEKTGIYRKLDDKKKDHI